MIRTVSRFACAALWRRLAAVLLVSGLGIGSLSGCQLLGVAAQGLPAPTIDAKYKGLAGQSVAVMVWADEGGVRIDWPQIHLDTAQQIQSKLQVAQSSAKPKELEGTRFPVSAASVVRLQEDSPELALQDATEIAPKLGTSRVICVEIHSFQTRSDAAVELFRGTATGSVRVIEVQNGKARVAFTDDKLKVTFPKDGPEEGMPSVGDYPIYRGVVDAFTTEVATRFFPHEAQDGEK